MLGTVSGPEQIAVGVIIGLTVILIPLLVRFLVGITRDVHEIKIVLVGEEATPFNPHPKKGLITTVDGLVDTVTLTLTGTRALIVDSKPDHGSTSRDALDRIEEEQQRLADNKGN